MGAGQDLPWPTPSKQRAAWLAVADPERLDAAEQRFVDALIARAGPRGPGQPGAPVQRHDTAATGRTARRLAGRSQGFSPGRVRRQDQARPQCGPLGADAALEHGAGGRADQPLEDHQANHVRPCGLRTAAPPRPPGSLRRVTAASNLHQRRGRTNFSRRHRLSARIPRRPRHRLPHLREVTGVAPSARGPDQPQAFGAVSTVNLTTPVTLSASGLTHRP